MDFYIKLPPQCPNPLVNKIGILSLTGIGGYRHPRLKKWRLRSCQICWVVQFGDKLLILAWRKILSSCFSLAKTVVRRVKYSETMFTCLDWLALGESTGSGCEYSTWRLLAWYPVYYAAKQKTKIPQFFENGSSCINLYNPAFQNSPDARLKEMFSFKLAIRVACSGSNSPEGAARGFCGKVYTRKQLDPLLLCKFPVSESNRRVQQGGNCWIQKSCSGWETNGWWKVIQDHRQYFVVDIERKVRSRIDRNIRRLILSLGVWEAKDRQSLDCKSVDCGQCI